MRRRRVGPRPRIRRRVRRDIVDDPGEEMEEWDTIYLDYDSLGGGPSRENTDGK